MQVSARQQCCRLFGLAASEPVEGEGCAHAQITGACDCACLNASLHVKQACRIRRTCRSMCPGVMQTYAAPVGFTLSCAVPNCVTRESGNHAGEACELSYDGAYDGANDDPFTPWQHALLLLYSCLARQPLRCPRAGCGVPAKSKVLELHDGCCCYVCRRNSRRLLLRRLAVSSETGQVKCPVDTRRVVMVMLDRATPRTHI